MGMSNIMCWIFYLTRGGHLWMNIIMRVTYSPEHTIIDIVFGRLNKFRQKAYSWKKKTILTPSQIPSTRNQPNYYWHIYKKMEDSHRGGYSPNNDGWIALQISHRCPLVNKYYLTSDDYDWDSGYENTF